MSQKQSLKINNSDIKLKDIVSFQKKKKSKEKPVVTEQALEVVVEESVALGQESPLPAVKKRRRRRHKVGVETEAASQKVRSVSAACDVSGLVSWHVRVTFSNLLISLTLCCFGNTDLKGYTSLSSFLFVICLHPLI